MGGGEGGQELRPGTTHRLAFSFRLEGDLRFISHRDTLRLVQRALARAGLPVRHSRGFNPRPRISLPCPRPVGVASDAEVLVVEFAREVSPEDALADLSRQMPPGITLLAARVAGPGERFLPARVRYRLDLCDRPAERIQSRIVELLAAQTLPVTRTSPKTGRVRDFDARPLLGDIRQVDDTVEFTLEVSQQGSVRPEEFAALLGFDDAPVLHRIRRMDIQWL